MAPKLIFLACLAAALVAIAVADCTSGTTGDIPGNDLGDVTTANTAKHCCSKCAETTGCLFWVFDTEATARCWFKTAKSTPVTTVTNRVYGAVDTNCNSIQVGRDVVGTDMKIVENVLYSFGCCASCKANAAAGCIAFAHDPTAKLCYLKSTNTGFAVKASITSGILGAAAPAPAPAPSTSVCTNTVGVDITGTDLTQVTATTADLCCAACTARTDCVGWVWANSGTDANKCWLKGSDTGRTVDTTRTSGVRAASCTSTTGIDYTGTDVLVTATSADLCCAACTAATTCLAWVWDSVGATNCWLKTTNTGSVVSATRISGLRTSTASPAPAPPASTGTCTETVGQDINAGSDLSTIASTSSSAACCVLCSANTACTHFVYSPSQTTCWLKAITGTPTSVTNADRTWGIRATTTAAPAPPPPSTTGTCTTTVGQDVNAGADLSSFTGIASAQACCALCTANTLCTHFVYDSGNTASSSCWLKAIAGTPTVITAAARTWGPRAVVTAPTPAPAPSPPASTTCVVNSGFDVGGTDLGTAFVVSSSLACCSVCTNTPGCVAWAFDISGVTSKCWLKSVLGTATVNSARSWGIPAGSATTCVTNPSQDIAGNDIAGSPVLAVSAQGCCAICRSTTSCVAWAYDQSGLTTSCWLKSTLGTATANTNRIWGSVSVSSTPCSVLAATDYPNFNLATVTASTAQLCCDACNANAQCSLWTWDGSVTCYLKTAGAIATVSALRTSGSRTVAIVNCNIQTATDYPSGDLGSTVSPPLTATADACCALCGTTTSCLYWSWANTGTQQCWLKSARTSIISNTARTSGARPVATSGIYLGSDTISGTTRVSTISSTDYVGNTLTLTFSAAAVTELLTASTTNPISLAVEASTAASGSSLRGVTLSTLPLSLTAVGNRFVLVATNAVGLISSGVLQLVNPVTVTWTGPTVSAMLANAQARVRYGGAWWLASETCAADSAKLRTTNLNGVLTFSTCVLNSEYQIFNETRTSVWEATKWAAATKTKVPANWKVAVAKLSGQKSGDWQWDIIKKPVSPFVTPATVQGGGFTTLTYTAGVALPALATGQCYWLKFSQSFVQANTADFVSVQGRSGASGTWTTVYTIATASALIGTNAAPVEHEVNLNLASTSSIDFYVRFASSFIKNKSVWSVDVPSIFSAPCASL